MKISELNEMTCLMKFDVQVNSNFEALPMHLLLGALDSQAGISRGIPNTKRCFKNPIECPTGSVGHKTGFWKHCFMF